MPASSQFLNFRSSIHPSSSTYHTPSSSSRSIGNLYFSSLALLSHLPQSPSLMTPDLRSHPRLGGKRTFSRFRGCSRARRSRKYRVPRYTVVDSTPWAGQSSILTSYTILTPELSTILPSYYSLLQAFGEKSIPAMFESMLTMQFKISTPFAPTISLSRSHPILNIEPIRD